jgi:Flp pilus assembly protein TadD
MLPGEQLDSSETLSGRVTAPSAFSSAAGNDLFKRACAAYELGRLQQAAGLCDQFLENEPHHAQALGLRGIVALGENDLQNASLFLRRALREEQNDALLHSYMGVVLHAQGKHRAAVRELHEAVMLNPKNSEIHFNLAVVQATAPRGNLQEARDAYEMALSLGNRRDQALESIVYP